MDGIYSWRTGYNNRAIDTRGSVLRAAALKLHSQRFDTIVATGISGLLIAPTLAMQMDKDLLIVRKEDDTSNHHGGELIGDMGARWIFVDDFIGTGRTFDRVCQQVLSHLEEQASWHSMHRVVKLVGMYSYNNERFVTAGELRQQHSGQPNILKAITGFKPTEITRKEF